MSVSESVQERLSVKLIEWYIKKHLSDIYVKKSEIGQAIHLAKKEEQKRLEAKFQKEKEQLLNEMKMDKLLAVEELKAQIAQISSEIQKYEDQVKKAQEAYVRSVRRTKANAIIAHDMAQQAKNILDVTSTIFGALEGIKARSASYLEQVKMDDEEERARLIMQESFV